MPQGAFETIVTGCETVGTLGLATAAFIALAERPGGIRTLKFPVPMLALLR